MNSHLAPSRLRCLTVWLTVSGTAGAVVCVIASDLVPQTTGTPDFDAVVVAAAAWALCAACAWASAVTGVVTLQVARSATVPRAGVPAPVRRLLVRACGVALAGGLTAGLATGPALATPGVLERDQSSRRSGPVPASAAQEAPKREVVVVAPGGSLWQVSEDLLAARTGRTPSNAAVAAYWPRLYAANRALVGPDPHLVRPGVPLAIPSDHPSTAMKER